MTFVYRQWRVQKKILRHQVVQYIILLSDNCYLPPLAVVAAPFRFSRFYAFFVILRLHCAIRFLSFRTTARVRATVLNRATDSCRPVFVLFACTRLGFLKLNSNYKIFYQRCYLYKNVRKYPCSKQFFLYKKIYESFFTAQAISLGTKTAWIVALVKSSENRTYRKDEAREDLSSLNMLAVVNTGTRLRKGDISGLDN